MGLQVPRVFTFSHRLKLLVLYIAFWSVVPRSSEAIKIRTSLMGNLGNEARNEVGQMIHQSQTDLLNSLLEGNMYKPGVVARMSYTFSTGKRIIFRLAYWNIKTCNLGLGSEAWHDIVVVPGAYITTVAQRLLLDIQRLVMEGVGMASCTEEGISVDYFPDSNNDASSSSDDETNNRLYGQSSVAQPQVPAAQVNFSSPRTGKRTTGRKTLQLDYSDDNVVATNPTINIFSPTFPKDLEGDCDLPSLILMTGTGPAIDVKGVHNNNILNPGDKIWSPSTRFVLEMQFDCNLVLYDFTTAKSLWTSKTFGQGTGCFAGLTMSGDLGVFDSLGSSLWLSQTACLPQADTGKCWTDTLLQVQDDGNLVLYISATQFPLWSSHTVQCNGGCTRF